MAAREADLSFKAISYDSNQNSNFTESSLQAENEQISSPSLPNSRDDANRQDDKRAFLNSKGENQDVLANRVRDRQSDFQLSAGTIIPGVLLSGVNSDLPGQILGQVSENIYDSVNGKYLPIPQGAKILGEYDSRVVYGQERVLIVWTRILFPDGSSINL